MSSYCYGRLRVPSPLLNPLIKVGPVPLLQPEDPVAIRLSPIDAQLAIYPEKDQEGAGHSQSQACDVDKGDHFVSPEIPPSNRQVIFQHGYLPENVIHDQSGPREDELDPVGPAGGLEPPNLQYFPEEAPYI